MLNCKKDRSAALSKLTDYVIAFNDEVDKAYKKSVEEHDYAEGLRLLGMQSALAKVMLFIAKANEKEEEE